jgi:hypothetical protein
MKALVGEPMTTEQVQEALIASAAAREAKAKKAPVKADAYALLAHAASAERVEQLHAEVAAQERELAERLGVLQRLADTVNEQCERVADYGREANAVADEVTDKLALVGALENLLVERGPAIAAEWQSIIDASARVAERLAPQDVAVVDMIRDAEGRLAQALSRVEQQPSVLAAALQLSRSDEHFMAEVAKLAARAEAGTVGALVASADGEVCVEVDEFGRCISVKEVS